MVDGEGTARLGVRPAHGGQDLPGVIDASVETNVRATSRSQRFTKTFEGALELVDVCDLEDLGVVDHAVAQIARSGAISPRRRSLLGRHRCRGSGDPAVGRICSDDLDYPLRSGRARGR